jgi:hypothetical protein
MGCMSKKGQWDEMEAGARFLSIFYVWIETEAKEIMYSMDCMRKKGQ